MTATRTLAAERLALAAWFRTAGAAMELGHRLTRVGQRWLHAHQARMAWEDLTPGERLSVAACDQYGAPVGFAALGWSDPVVYLHERATSGSAIPRLHEGHVLSTGYPRVERG